MTATATTIIPETSSNLKTRLAGFVTRPYSRAIGLYLVGALVALLPVGAGGWPSAFTRLVAVSVSVALYFVITFLFNHPGRLRWLVAAIVAATALVAVFGTAQVNTTSLRLTGLNFQVYSTLRSFLPLNGLPTVHQNVLGGFLAVFLPLALALAVWDRNLWLRLYGLGCAAVITGAILTTASRSAQSGLVALFFVFGFLLAAGHPRLRCLLGIALAISLAAGGVYLMANGLASIENGTSRTEVWRSTLTMAADYPLTGAGLGQYEKHFPDYATPFLSGTAQPHAHNLFLQSLVEFGLAGFIAMLMALGTTIRLLLNYSNLKRVGAATRPVVAGALGGMAVCFVVGLLEYGNWGGKFAPAFWVLPGLLAASHLQLPPLNFNKLALYKKLFPLAGDRLQRLRLPLILAVTWLALFLIVPLGLINLASILRPAPASQVLYGVSAGLSFWNAAPLRNSGELAAGRNDAAAARTYYLQALQRDPDDWLSLRAAANLAEKAGDHAQAVIYWRKAASEPYFLQLAAQELRRTPPEYHTAEGYLKLALEVNPGATEAVRSLVKVYTDTDRRKEAAALLQDLLSQKPDAALYEQAADLAATGQERLSLVLKSSNLDPTNYIIYWKIGEAYQEVDRLEMAEKAYKQALVMRPAFQWPVRSLGDMYLRQGRTTEAQALLDKFIENNVFVEKPDREFVLLARTYFKQAKTEAARTTLNKAFQHNPASVAAYLFQGELFKNDGNIEQARQSYRKVLELDSGNETAHQALELLG